MEVKRTAALACLCLVALSSAQKARRQHGAEWDYRPDEKGNTKSCANLTMVLDNWKFAITTQVKDLLLNDHRTVLPDYGRIQPLSEALGDLYKEFNSLKDRLGELTARFDRAEAFAEDMRMGRGPPPPRAEHPALPSQDPATPAAEGGREQGHRKRVIRKKPKSPPA
ncbi:uncharacterized protein si:dkey-282h22.5 [Anguilla rostrata]|uniref:uncharacterized protein si:dkey-282h22.5 n=1 Tax=Anguilla rostrata TaxID=7938 RepID=UPI0030D2CB6F